MISRPGESVPPPAKVSLPNRNDMNLLELPTLFFPVCLMFSVALRVDSLVVHIAWAFLVLRAPHSAIHLTYNDVKHRLVAFALGNVALGTQVG
jgi:hypothetical protein